MEEFDLSIEEQEEIEREEQIEKSCCSTGCMDCLGIDWSDFL